LTLGAQKSWSALRAGCPISRASFAREVEILISWSVKEQSVKERSVKEQSVKEQGVKERSVEEQGVKERSVKERSVEERSVEERSVEERSVEERRFSAALAIRDKSGLQPPRHSSAPKIHFFFGKYFFSTDATTT